jgi:eukaryotic-like serine/threonine-protein kinase
VLTDISGGSIGRYHLLEPLGQGGMAVVYRAYDTRLEREVALKLIRMEAFPPEVYDRILARFEREAKALAKMAHPHIVRVFDYGEYESAPYLVMELLEGGTLKQSLSGRLPVGAAAGLLAPVADALAYAHRRGILHRDVKPSNILLTEEGQVVLTDFGIAKLLAGEGERTLTGTGMGIGTPEYMAPEQGLGREVDGRADVYALGVMLFELLTGRKPYTADTPMAVILKQVNDPLPRPRDLVPDLPPDVERVLLKALAKKPEDRYEDMEAFAVVLKRLAALENPTIVLDPELMHRAMDAAEVATGENAVESLPSSARWARVASDTLETAETQDDFEVEARRSPATKRGGKFAARMPDRRRLSRAGVGLALLAVAGVLLAAGVGWVQKRSQITSAAVQSTIEAHIRTTAEMELGKQTAFAGVPTATPAARDMMTRVREIDGMLEVYIPAGKFIMGSTREDPDADDDEFPQHEVYLDAYWIDQTEVTNGQYQLCVAEEVCTVPNKSPSSTRSSYYGEAAFADFPVIYLIWNQAATYCEWAGGRLPSEAEWEKAARGEDGRLYPWGNENPTCELSNSSSCIGDTVPVGSHPDAASPYGVLDMAGNVSEWVADWYDTAYYERSPGANPSGPSSGAYHLLRGGSWNSNIAFLRTASRLRPVSTWYDVGFRCARSP